MKKIILAMGFMTLITTVNANTCVASIVTGVYQDDNGVSEKVAQATEKLGLTKDQQAKYKDYLVRKDAEKKDLMAKNRDASDADKKAAQQKFKDKYQAELKKILTAEQWKKLESGK